MKIPVLRIAVGVCLFAMFSGSVREAPALPPNPHVNPPADCLPASDPSLPCIPLDTLRQWIEKGIPEQQYKPDPYKVKRVHIHTQEKTT